MTIGSLLLFSTESGDAWILDLAEHLATRLAAAGDPQPVHLEETDTSVAVGWRGRYALSGSAFVFSDDDLGRVTTMMGYPIREITARIREVFGDR